MLIFLTKKYLLFFCCLVIVNFIYAQKINNLNYYLHTAENNSPLLNDYNNQILSSRIDSLKLRAAYGFILTGEGNAMFSPVIKGWGYDKALTNGQTLFAGGRIMREFIGQNNLQTRLDGMNLSIAQILAQKNISLDILRKQITDQYINTYSTQQQLSISSEIIHLLQQQDIVLKKLTQAAIFKQTDYLNFLVNLQQNQLSLEQKKVEMKSSYALLNYLCGIVDTAVQNLEIPIIPNVIIRSFNSSKYAIAFNADSAKLANNASVIEYDYKPKITGFADGGYQSSLVATPFKNFGVSVGLSISLPLYDGHKKQMLLNQNRIQMDTRKKYYNLSKLQYEQQLSQIQSELVTYTQLRESANQQLKYVHTLIDANAKQLPTGDIKMVDFIMSVNNLLNLKSLILQYDTTILGLKNQLQYIIL